MKKLKKKDKKKQYEVTNVCGVEIYNKTVVVVREKKDLGIANKGTINLRNNIGWVSNASLKRLAFVVINSDTQFLSMMTLTEPSDYSCDGRDFKRRLALLLDWYRFNYSGHSYLWWLEFQKRGAPHIHLLSTVDLKIYGKLDTIRSVKKLAGVVRPGMPPLVKVSYWDTYKPAWQNLEMIWGKLGGGMTRWEIVKYKGGARSYILKYATKTDQRVVPEEYQDVGRFWGHSYDVKPKSKQSFTCTEKQLRQSLKDWKYLTKDFLYRELYQCSDKVDTSVFQQSVCKHCGVVLNKLDNHCSDCGASLVWPTE